MKRILLIILAIFLLHILPAFAQQQTQSIEINNIDYTAIPHVRSIEINNADFIGYPAVRSIEINNIDYTAIPKVRSIEISGVDFVAKVQNKIIDIAVQEIRPPRQAFAGDKAELYVTVKNLSNIPVKEFDVALNCDDGFKAQERVGPAAVGETKRIRFEWPMEKLGRFRVRASVELAEDSNRSNNEVSITVEVQERPAQSKGAEQVEQKSRKTKEMPLEYKTKEIPLEK